MDAFYASIEQRDNPHYRGKPLAVGYSGPRGVVAAASYEARRYGVRSAMASKTAIRKCPYLIFAPARFEIYKSVSKQIMEIFHEYTDIVEPLSLDEAFLDVTINHKDIASATQIAKEIKQKIYEKTSLTASAGVSFNKFLAKIASDYNKPNGLFVVKPKDAERFVESLAIEQFFGVGKVTAKQMHDLGIRNGLDLKQRTEEELVRYFGKAGLIYYQNARGVDDRPVESERERKSISSENTFERDIDNLEELALELDIVAKDAFADIVKKKFKGRTITLKIKYADFKVITRSKTFSFPIEDYTLFYQEGYELLKNVDISPKVRLIGLGLKKSEDDPVWQDAIQLRINFDDYDV